MEKNIELVALDLDGTLVHDGEISPEDKMMVNRVLEKNFPLIPATTRLRRSAAELLSSIDLNDHPIVCNNGARVVGPGWMYARGWEQWKLTRLKAEVARTAAEYSDDRGYKLSTIFPEKVYRKKEKCEGKRYPGAEIAYIESNVIALSKGTPINLMMHKSENDLRSLKDMERFVRDEFEDEVRIDRHHRGEEYRSLTIYDKEVSKVAGLQMVCDALNISLEAVLAIGDDEVDKEMIEQAGIGIAMDDAPEEVKRAADVVAPDCRRNGVAWVLDRYIFNS